MPEVLTRVDEGDSRKNWTAERAAIARAEAYRIKSEHERLRSAVVDASRTWRAEFGGNIFLEAMASTALAQDVDALLAFEAEHEIGDQK